MVQTEGIIENFTAEDKARAEQIRTELFALLDESGGDEDLPPAVSDYLAMLRPVPYPNEDGRIRRIYLITNKINGKMYVGQTVQEVEQRWKDHIKHARNKKGFYLQEAIRKYGPESFEVGRIYTARNQQEADEVEKIYIWMLGTHDPDRGYNLTFGGSGVVPTNLAKKHLADSLGGRNGMRGKKHTAEARLKMSLARKGKPHSPAHTKALANATRERWKTMSEEEKQKFFSGRDKWNQKKTEQARLRRLQKKNEQQQNKQGKS